MPVVIRAGVAILRKELELVRQGGQKIGLIPTMGFLHEGHLSLIKESVSRGEFPVVTVFVNPTQFGPNEDLDSYPRNEEQDIFLSGKAGAGMVWIPEVHDIYPNEKGLDSMQIKVVPGSISQKLCGTSRPVFFTGICTVVLKLFNSVQPDSAYFGEKDFQQLQIIRTMVKELHLTVKIIGCPIIREEDGLAMSSRNVKIPPTLRHVALHMYRTIQAARGLFSQNPENAESILKILKKDWPDKLELDYLEFRSPETLEIESQLKADTRIFLGAWLKDHSGSRGVRLIDNSALGN